MPALLRSGTPIGVAYSSAGPQPPCVPMAGGGGSFGYQAGSGGNGPGDGSGPVQIQQKMVRQRQLALERQRAAVRQGMGVVAQSNPLAAASAEQLKSSWGLLPDSQGADKPGGNIPGTAGNAGAGLVPSALAKRQLGASRGSPLVAAGAVSTGTGGAPTGIAEAAARAQDCPADDHEERPAGAAPQKRAGASRGPAGTAGLSIDEMLEGLDVEELVDQLNRDTRHYSHDHPAVAARPAGSPSVPVRALAGDVPSAAAPGRRPRGPAAEGDNGGAAGGPNLKTKVWGLDDRLTVQGPPPKVVTVEGFDEPATNFAGPGERGTGRRRQRSASGDALAEGKDHDRNEQGTPLQDFGLSGENWGSQAERRPPAPAAARWDLPEERQDTVSPKPSTNESKGSRPRWWKPFQGNAQVAPGGRRPSDAGQLDTVTQISAFNADD